jgi:aspartyl-tRNA(Asn)/glutamyl-tRNA(Gln) amidotransferase subunit A
VTGDIRGVRIGVPGEFIADSADPAIARNVMSRVEALRLLGADVKEVSLPHSPYTIACYYVLTTAEASSNLARYDGVRFGRRSPHPAKIAGMYAQSRSEGFGPEVRRRVMLGTYVLSAGYYEAFYLKAQKVRRLIREEFDRVFSSVDCLITPTSPTTAFRLGEKTSDPVQMYLSDIFTVGANLAGLPAMSVPCGTAADGLPVGLQIMGKSFDEETVLRVGNAVELCTTR